ncbi:hypothetical protein LX32DRAFT_223967 [Colletotrichum zoysiae]|uniref:Uncharacterized protein n=1 Tax=Colletotrichum zoysiae TaxID=1216348 RepID=A0AAD9LXK8_9PEZI|nr:hypothetical protein LX32DRAFT_223967 [Colletotrichum zoysiae]
MYLLCSAYTQSALRSKQASKQGTCFLRRTQLKKARFTGPARRPNIHPSIHPSTHPREQGSSAQRCSSYITYVVSRETSI